MGISLVYQHLKWLISHFGVLPGGPCWSYCIYTPPVGQEALIPCGLLADDDIMPPFTSIGCSFNAVSHTGVFIVSFDAVQIWVKMTFKKAKTKKPSLTYNYPLFVSSDSQLIQTVSSAVTLSVQLY